MRKFLLFLIFVICVISSVNAETLSYGYASGYTNWNTDSCNGKEGCVSKIFYKNSCQKISTSEKTVSNADNIATYNYSMASTVDTGTSCKLIKTVTESYSYGGFGISGYIQGCTIARKDSDAWAAPGGKWSWTNDSGCTNIGTFYLTAGMTITQQVWSDIGNYRYYRLRPTNYNDPNGSYKNWALGVINYTVSCSTVTSTQTTNWVQDSKSCPSEYTYASTVSEKTFYSYPNNEYYKVSCLVDSNNRIVGTNITLSSTDNKGRYIVSPSSKINLSETIDGNYKLQTVYFKINKTDKNNYEFCISNSNIEKVLLS